MAKYSLPKNLYHQTLWFIKQNDEKRAEYDSIAWQAAEQDGQPKSTVPSDPTGARALRAARLSEDLHAVNKALELIPEYYRKPVYENTVRRTRWPEYANRKTYCKYKRKFIYYVAYIKGWVTTGGGENE